MLVITWIWPQEHLAQWERKGKPRSKFSMLCDSFYIAFANEKITEANRLVIDR